jgi:hypothetical protein
MSRNVTLANGPEWLPMVSVERSPDVTIYLANSLADCPAGLSNTLISPKGRLISPALRAYIYTLVAATGHLYPSSHPRITTQSPVSFYELTNFIEAG